MKGKCLNQGGLSSWLQISSANVEFVIKFIRALKLRFFLSEIIGFKVLKIFFRSIGAAMAVCSKCFVGSSSVCCIVCISYIWGAYRVHLIMGFSFYLVCFKIIRRMQQSFKTSAA